MYALMIVVTLLSTPAQGEMDRFFYAIGQVESNNDDSAVGDNGNAIGRYQIWRVYWLDATEFDKSIGGEYEDCRDPRYAQRVMLAYWRRYCPEALESGNWERLARTHNGGCVGYKRESAHKYWIKVKKVLHDD